MESIAAFIVWGMIFSVIGNYMQRNGTGRVSSVSVGSSRPLMNQGGVERGV